MTETNVQNLLVIGVDLVSLAASSKKAGYQVYAVSYFGDQDLEHICLETRSIVQQRPKESCGRLSTNFSPERLLLLTKDLVAKNEIHGALLSSGLDDSPDVLSELNELIPIIGNRPEEIKTVRDKAKFFRELKRLQIPHPETAIVKDLREATKTSKDVGLPVLVKPVRGFGGAGIRKVKDSQELKQAFQDAVRFNEEIVIQEYISGKPASVSLISTTNGAVALTLNEQLLGISEVGQKELFGYCGNVVPFSTTKAAVDKCKGIAEKIALHWSLVGSNGVDLVISKEGTPYVIEVNPRFQGTLECVERTLSMNIVKAHVEACFHRRLPTVEENPSAYCVRLLLFAPQRSTAPDLGVFEEARDIPLSQVIIEEGEPVCSIVVDGTSRNSSLREAKKIAKLIQRLLRCKDHPSS